MKNFLFLALLLYSGFCNAQLSPFGGLGVQTGTFMPSLYAEFGATNGRAIAFIDTKYYTQSNIYSIGLKGGVMAIPLDYELLNGIYVLAGVSSYKSTGKSLKRQTNPLVSLRWQYYNVATEIGWQDKGIFISLGWDFKRIFK